MKNFKRISRSLLLAVMLVAATSISALALTVNDGDGNGYANFGLKSGSSGYYFEYCYYYQSTTSHWATAAYKGYTSGTKPADAGKTAQANSPSSFGSGWSESRNWGKN